VSTLKIPDSKIRTVNKTKRKVSSTKKAARKKLGLSFEPEVSGLLNTG
jgi:hypothetical protein